MNILYGFSVPNCTIAFIDRIYVEFLWSLYVLMGQYELTDSGVEGIAIHNSVQSNDHLGRRSVNTIPPADYIFPRLQYVILISFAPCV